jgi:hypothetical protein
MRFVVRRVMETERKSPSNPPRSPFTKGEDDLFAYEKPNLIATLYKGGRLSDNPPKGLYVILRSTATKNPLVHHYA